MSALFEYICHGSSANKGFSILPGIALWESDVYRHHIHLLRYTLNNLFTNESNQVADMPRPWTLQKRSKSFEDPLNILRQPCIVSQIKN